MTTHTQEFNLAEITQHCVRPNSIKHIYKDTVNANGIDVSVSMEISTHNSKIAFGVYFYAHTCTVYREIEFEAEMGFLNSNGNLCQKGTIKRTYKYPDADKKSWGRQFYTISLVDLGKIERYYACGDKLKIQYRILKCSVHPCLEQVLRSIYMASDAGKIDKLQRSYVELQESNCSLIVKVDELEKLLEDALGAAEYARSVQSAPSVPSAPSAPSVPSVPPTVSVQEQISRMEIDQLNELSEKIKERVNDLQRCKICLDERSDTLLMPCRHMCMCRSCADNYPESTCPVCRGPIRDKIRVYQS